MNKKLCCPKCKSDDIQYIILNETNITSQGGGYSGGKGCLGYILMGPLGLLCGACGNKQKTTTQTKQASLWVCKNCGNKFKGADEINSEIENKNIEIKSNKLLILIMSIFSVLMFILSILSDIGFLILFGGTFMAFAIVAVILNTKVKKEICELEKELKYISENAFTK